MRIDLEGIDIYTRYITPDLPTNKAMSDATTSKRPNKIIISLGELGELHRLIDLAQTIIEPKKGKMIVHVPLIGDSEEELRKELKKRIT